MADLTAQSVTRSGAAIDYDPATVGGDTAPVGDQYVLAVHNGDATSKDVALGTPKTVDGLDVAERTLAVAAAATALIRLGPRDLYDDGQGRVAITYPGGVTSLEVAVLQA